MPSASLNARSSNCVSTSGGVGGGEGGVDDVGGGGWVMGRSMWLAMKEK